MSFFCPYEPGAKEKRKADRNTDNRPTLSAFRAVFIFSFACGDSRKAKGPEALEPARRVTGLHKKSWTPHPPGFHTPRNAFHSQEYHLFLPQQFLYFFPLPQGQGSFGYTLAAPLFTGAFGPESSLLVPVTLATCSLSTFCSTLTWNSRRIVSSRIPSVMASNIS